MLRSLISILTLLFALSCSEGGSEGGGNMPSVPNRAEFSALVDGYETTRTGKEMWAVDDEVEIASAMSSTLSSGAALQFQRYYITDAATGALAPNDEAQHIYYVDGASNSYFAIYPTGRITSGSNSFEVDLSDQSGGVEGLDMLYASTTMSNQQSDEVGVSLSFVHQYALVTLSFSAELDPTTRIYMQGARSRGEFDIVSGIFTTSEVADIEMKYDSASRSSSALVLPWQNTADIKVMIVQPRSVYIYKPSTVDPNGNMVIWGVGKEYKYSVTL